MTRSERDEAGLEQHRARRMPRCNRPARGAGTPAARRSRSTRASDGLSLVLARVRLSALLGVLALLAPGGSVHAQAAAPASSTQAPASSTQAPGDSARRWVDARRMDRLEASIVELAHSDGLIRSWGSVGALVLGGTAIVGGVLIALDDDDWGGHGRAAVSGIAWSAGASLIAAGVYRWLSQTPAEQRLERWSELRQREQLDLYEFSRFEGELASEALLATFNRRLAAFSSLGLVSGGAALIGFSASKELEGSAQRSGYVLGSVLAGVGAIQTIALLIVPTPAERAWRHYAEGGAGFFSRLTLSPELAQPPARF